MERVEQQEPAEKPVLKTLAGGAEKVRTIRAVSRKTQQVEQVEVSLSVRKDAATLPPGGGAARRTILIQDNY